MTTKKDMLPDAVKIRELGKDSPPHDFDGITAVGDWVVCEHVASQAITPGGIIVPDAAQTPIWQVISAGPDATGIVKDMRILFIDPNATFVHENRRFGLLRRERIVATLPMPDPEKAPRLVIASDMPKAKAMTIVNGGRA